MSSWFDRYKNAMYATRLIGMVAASIIVFCVIYSISNLYRAIAINETVGASAVLPALFRQHFALVVGVVALWRIVVLAWSKSHSFAWQISSWWLLVASIFCYAWAAFPRSHTICGLDGICFGIYDMSSFTDFVGLAGMWFILGSILRFSLTVVTVLVVNRRK